MGRSPGSTSASRTRRTTRTRRRSRSRCPKTSTSRHPEPVAGWTRTEVKKEKLDEPVEIEEGVRGNRAGHERSRSKPTATASRPARSRTSACRVLIPGEPGETLNFPAIQTCEKGEVGRWIGEPDAEEPSSNGDRDEAPRTTTPRPPTMTTPMSGRGRGGGEAERPMRRRGRRQRYRDRRACPRWPRLRCSAAPAWPARGRANGGRNLRARGHARQARRRRRGSQGKPCRACPRSCASRRPALGPAP